MNLKTWNLQGRAPASAGGTGRSRERAGKQIPTAWLMCSSAEVQSDEMQLLWANLGAVGYNFVFTAQHTKANK